MGNHDGCFVDLFDDSLSLEGVLSTDELLLLTNKLLLLSNELLLVSEVLLSLKELSGVH